MKVSLDSQARMRMVFKGAVCSSLCSEIEKIQVIKGQMAVVERRRPLR